MAIFLLDVGKSFRRGFLREFRPGDFAPNSLCFNTILRSETVVQWKNCAECLETLAKKNRGGITEYRIYMGLSTKRTSISLPEALLKEGRRLAKRRRRNFSNYVADLIAADAEKNANACPDEEEDCEC